MRILIIEDEPSITQIICDYYCKPNGHECIAVATLGAAIAAGIDFDCVVCDLNLPDSDGWNTLITIRGRLPAKTPIVVLSGAISVRDAPKAIEYGATDILFKPWLSPVDFANRIDLAMERSRHPVIDQLAAKISEAKDSIEAIKSTNESLAHLKESVRGTRKGHPILIF